MVSVPHRLRPVLPRSAARGSDDRITARAKRRPVKRTRQRYIIIRTATLLMLYAAMALFAVFYISSMMSGGFALTAYVNGKAAASVSDPGVINAAVRALTLVSTDLDADFGDGALPPLIDVPKFDFKIDYKFALTQANGGKSLKDASECLGVLYNLVRENYTYAFAIYADNFPVAAGAHYDDAAQAVERIECELTEAALTGGENLDKVRISTGIRVKYALCEKSRILSAEGLYARLSELLSPRAAGNPRVKSSAPSNADYKIGYGINRVVTVGGEPVVAASVAPELLTENIKVESVTVVLDEKTVYVESDEYYIGESFTQTEGAAGLERVTYDLIMDGGVEMARRVAAREVLADPVNKVIVVGTSELPQPVPTGAFGYPVAPPHEITSQFGEQREEYDGDSYHYGADFEGDKGDPIYAADGGTVIYAGYSPSYGLMIGLDHGNGITSRYAHCSELLFGVGDAVYKGQKIALIGDTGAATGPHLHFEIRENGVYEDPIKYLGK